jgi:hypothetical protein
VDKKREGILTFASSSLNLRSSQTTLVRSISPERSRFVRKSSFFSLSISSLTLLSTSSCSRRRELELRGTVNVKSDSDLDLRRMPPNSSEKDHPSDTARD